MRRLTLALLTCLLCDAARADVPADPMQSPLWPALAKALLTDAPIVFDDRVKVTLPAVVEDQAQAPVSADARALGRVEKLIVFADRNPIQHVLTLEPKRAEAYVSFRMKVEQGTPVRAAALSDGVWHVGGAWLDAMGGGCSAPPVKTEVADWSETVGRTQGRLWREASGDSRLRFRISHPMDTGITRDNNPAFYIETVDVKDAGGEALAALKLFEPVSQDPTLTLSLHALQGDGAFIDARDNNGGVFRSVVTGDRRQSAVAPAAMP